MHHPFFRCADIRWFHDYQIFCTTRFGRRYNREKRMYDQAGRYSRLLTQFLLVARVMSPITDCKYWTDKRYLIQLICLHLLHVTGKPFPVYTGVYVLIVNCFHCTSCPFASPTGYHIQLDLLITDSK